MHKTITLAALETGRHVLCQARMANTAAEAREMLAASQSPSEPRLHARAELERLQHRPGDARACIGSDLLGEILSVDVHRLQRGFAELRRELDWRHNSEFSGVNVLNVGAIYELMMRWLGPGDHVIAKTRVQIPTRRNEQGVHVVGDDTGSRRGAVRAREWRAGSHVVQRDDGALARQ